MKIGWNTYYSYWGYNYNEDVDYVHEISFGRLYICWKGKK